ncbi:hypothetical protein ABZ137_38990 [Streptomyces bobili]|uniref:hypothetical protein n=1 Tax=Streptomyces bobili TaxID=67280 RepID=UPI0033AADEEB
MSSSATSPFAQATGTAAHRSRTVVIALCWGLVLLDGIDTFIYDNALPKMLGDHSLGLTPDTVGTIGSYATSACCSARSCPLRPSHIARSRAA